MRLYLYILSASLAFGQSQSELKIIPKQDDSATGIIKFQEKYGSGLNYVGVRAPSSIPANVTWTLPSADGTSGQCLQTDGSGQWGWAACIINGGNTTGATLTIGTNDAQTLSLETNGTGRWSIPITGHLYAGANNTYDIGAGLAANSPRSIYAATSIVTPKIGRDTSASFTIMTDSADRWIFNSAGMLYPALDNAYDSGLIGTRARVSYAHNFDGAPSGTTGNYMATRKLQLTDAAGATGFWYLSANATTGTSSLNIIDNAGSRWLRGYRALSSSPSNDTFVYSNWIPAGRTIAGGDAVDDAVLPTMGITGTRWSKAFINTHYANWYGEDVKPLTNTLVLGGASDRWANTYSVLGNFSSTLTTVGLTINTGAATVGYVWTATSTGGAGSWQAVSGAGLPVADTTNIVKGSADTSKLLRFEVDGFTTATTRTLTPQNNSYTIAGTDISQTFSNTQTFSGTLAVSGTIGDDFIPNSDGTYSNGTTSFRWGSVATYNADFNGVLTLQSGTTFTGSILPTTNNLYALGNTSYRMSNIATVNANISGTVTAPNGNTGLSATKTVGDGAGGSCTLTISGGLITASTCP